MRCTAYPCSFTLKKSSHQSPKRQTLGGPYYNDNKGDWSFSCATSTSNSPLSPEWKMTNKFNLSKDIQNHLTGLKIKDHQKPFGSSQGYSLFGVGILSPTILINHIEIQYVAFKGLGQYPYPQLKPSSSSFHSSLSTSASGSQSKSPEAG